MKTVMILISWSFLDRSLATFQFFLISELKAVFFEQKTLRPLKIFHADQMFFSESPKSNAYSRGV